MCHSKRVQNIINHIKVAGKCVSDACPHAEYSMQSIAHEYADCKLRGIPFVVAEHSRGVVVCTDIEQLLLQP